MTVEYRQPYARRGNPRNELPSLSFGEAENTPGDGATNGDRTRNPRLGKPVLYQLSYYRMRESKSLL